MNEFPHKNDILLTLLSPNKTAFLTWMGQAEKNPDPEKGRRAGIDLDILFDKANTFELTRDDIVELIQVGVIEMPFASTCLLTPRLCPINEEDETTLKDVFEAIDFEEVTQEERALVRHIMGDTPPRTDEEIWKSAEEKIFKHFESDEYRALCMVLGWLEGKKEKGASLGEIFTAAESAGLSKFGLINGLFVQKGQDVTRNGDIWIYRSSSIIAPSSLIMEPKKTTAATLIQIKKAMGTPLTKEEEKFEKASKEPN